VDPGARRSGTGAPGVGSERGLSTIAECLDERLDVEDHSSGKLLRQPQQSETLVEPRRAFVEGICHKETKGDGTVQGHLQSKPQRLLEEIATQTLPLSYDEHNARRLKTVELVVEAVPWWPEVRNPVGEEVVDVRIQYYPPLIPPRGQPKPRRGYISKPRVSEAQPWAGGPTHPQP